MSIHRRERIRQKRALIDEFIKFEVDSHNFSGRLNALFSAVSDSGASITNTGLSKALAVQGIKCSPPYISQLRTGNRMRPSVALAHGIADVFGVPRGYFHLRLEGTDGTKSGYIGLTSDALIGLHLNTVVLERLLRDAVLLPESMQELLSDLAAKLAHGHLDSIRDECSGAGEHGIYSITDDGMSNYRSRNGVGVAL